MSTQAVISANPTLNNGGTLLCGGTIATGGPVTEQLTHRNSATNPLYAFVVQAGANQSGNLGTFKPLTSARFNSQEAGHYIANTILDQIAGVANTTVRSMGADVWRAPEAFAEGNYGYGIRDYSYISGIPVYNSNRGVLQQYINPETGSAVTEETRPTNAVPGKLCYQYGGALAQQDTYKARTST